MAEAAWASALEAARKPQTQEEPLCATLSAGGLLLQTGWLERMLPAALLEQFQLVVLLQDAQMVSVLRALLLGLRALHLPLVARSLAQPDAARRGLGRLLQPASLWLLLAWPASPLPLQPQHLLVLGNACGLYQPDHSPANSSAFSSR